MEKTLDTKLLVEKNNQNIKHLYEKIIVYKQELVEEMENYGMQKQTIVNMFEGKEIINCDVCNTPNMCKVSQNIEGFLDIYQCSKCGEIYTE